MTKKESHSESSEDQETRTPEAAVDCGWKVPGNWGHAYFLSRRVVRGNILAEVEAGINPLTGEAFDNPGHQAFWEWCVKWTSVRSDVVAYPEAHTTPHHSAELRCAGDGEDTNDHDTT